MVLQLNFLFIYFQKVTSQVFKLLETSGTNLGADNITEKAELLQYIEYILVYVSHISNPQNVNAILQVCYVTISNSKLITSLQELNGLLASKTYLVGYHLTVVDILLYYMLWDVVVSYTVRQIQQ